MTSDTSCTKKDFPFPSRSGSLLTVCFLFVVRLMFVFCYCSFVCYSFIVCFFIVRLWFVRCLFVVRLGFVVRSLVVSTWLELVQNQRSLNVANALHRIQHLDPKECLTLEVVLFPQELNFKPGFLHSLIPLQAQPRFV